MSLNSLRFRRWRQKRRGLAAPLQHLLAQPVPSGRTPFLDLELLSLDIETTGLDPASAEMLSVGWAVVRNGKVDLSTAQFYLVRPDGEVGNSASVHGLTDTVVGAGSDSGIVLGKIIEALTGRVLLVHYAGLDKRLLDRLCRQCFGVPLLVPVVDTLALERRRQLRRHAVEAQSSLRLPDLRDRYHLPRYSAHDSLVDAIATAELLIAMVAHSDTAKNTRLRDLCS